MAKKDYLKNPRGYVYIFVNEKHPNVVKLGMTESTANTLEKRIKVANKGTFVYGELKEYWSKEVENSYLAERFLHNAFREFYEEKEFFRIAPKIAVILAEKALKSLDRCIKRVDKDILKETDAMIDSFGAGIKGMEAALKFSNGESRDKLEVGIRSMKKRLEYLLELKNQD